MVMNKQDAGLNSSSVFLTDSHLITHTKTRFLRTILAKYGLSKSVLLLTILCSFSATVLSVFTWVYILGQDFIQPVIWTPLLVSIVLCPIFALLVVGTTLDLHYLESQMRRLASYDVLTDVYTRRLFLESCEHLLSLMQRDKKDFVFAYIDLDDFKQINDVYGHAAGDEVLKAFSVLLRSQVRKSDLVGRMGGEEFGLALPETDRKGAEHLLEEIRLLARQTTIEVDDREIGFTVSIGFTYTDNSQQKPLDKLIKKADAALYMAKGTGKDRIHYVNCH